MPFLSSASTDEPLLKAWVGSRDETAFRVLVEKYTALVFNAALRKTGREDWAEEVTQEVFVTLARRAPELDGGGGLAGWLHRTAVLTAATRLRAESRRGWRLRRFAALVPQGGNEELPSGEDWSRFRPRLDDALATLPELDRRVIFERFFDRRTYAEIADRAGLPHEAVRKRGLRALEKLSRRLGRRGGAAPTVAILSAGLGEVFRESAPAALVLRAGAAGGAAAAGAGGGGAGAVLLFAMKSTILPAGAVILVTGLTAVFWPKSASIERGDDTFSQTPPATRVATRVAPDTANTRTLSASAVPRETDRAPKPPGGNPSLSDPDPALKEAFQNDPRTKRVEIIISAFKKGHKRMLDRKNDRHNALLLQRDDAVKKAANTSLNIAERARAKSVSDELSAEADRAAKETEQFRIVVEAWLRKEVNVARANIVEQIKNGTRPPPELTAPEKGSVPNTAGLDRLEKGGDLVEATDYAGALGVFKALAGHSDGPVNTAAWWNVMLCGMITDNGEETDAAAARLIRGYSPGAACFAMAAREIGRGEWSDAQLWVLQAEESGEPAENDLFRESLIRLGWMDPASGALLEPPAGE